LLCVPCLECGGVWKDEPVMEREERIVQIETGVASPLPVADVEGDLSPQQSQRLEFAEVGGQTRPRLLLGEYPVHYLGTLSAPVRDRSQDTRVPCNILEFRLEEVLRFLP